MDENGLLWIKINKGAKWGLYMKWMKIDYGGSNVLKKSKK